MPAYLSMTTAGVWLAIVSRCVEAGSEGVCSSEQEGCRGFGASGRPRCFQVEDEAASLEVTLVVIGGSASPTSNASPSSRRYPGQLGLCNHVECGPSSPSSTKPNACRSHSSRSAVWSKNWLVAGRAISSQDE